MTYQLTASAAAFYESTFVPALFREWAQKLVTAASIQPGERVLDVACGTGIVARSVPDGASVVGLDLNEAMLDVARAERPDLDWRVGDAQALPFPEASFDVVLSQAGLMFFPDRVGAVREMGRVLRPSGRLALQVPGRLSHSPGYVRLTDVVARHAGQDVVDLFTSYFVVGEPDLLTSIVHQAGLRLDAITTWTGATRLPSMDAFLDVELLPIADRVPADVRANIIEDCRAALASFVDAAGAVAAPIEVQLLTARPA